MDGTVVGRQSAGIESYPIYCKHLAIDLRRDILSKLFYANVVHSLLPNARRQGLVDRLIERYLTSRLHRLNPLTLGRFLEKAV